MRRKDREITELYEIVDVMKHCDVCRIGLNDGGVPYIVPLNFGMKLEKGQITLYFHGAVEGKKYELMKNQPLAAFEMDCEHRLVMDESGECTMEYRCVMGRGVIEETFGDEKRESLNRLMEHYYPQGMPWNEKTAAVTRTFKLTVSELSAKRRKKVSR